MARRCAGPGVRRDQRAGTPELGDGTGDEESRGRGHASDEHRLYGAAYGRRAGEVSLHITEDGECDQREHNRGDQRGGRLVLQDVRRQWDEAAPDVSAGDGEGAAQRALRVRLLQAPLTAPPEI